MKSRASLPGSFPRSPQLPQLSETSCLRSHCSRFGLLRELYLNDNQLQRLPDGFGDLKNLRRLSRRGSVVSVQDGSLLCS